MKFAYQSMLTNTNGDWQRWGGGWKWKLGVMVSDHQVNLDLLILELSFYWGAK